MVKLDTFGGATHFRWKKVSIGLLCFLHVICVMHIHLVSSSEAPVWIILG